MQYNLVPSKERWCSADGKVTTGLSESNGILPPRGWLMQAAGWLPVHQDQLRAQLSVTSMGSLYLFGSSLLTNQPLPEGDTQLCLIITEGIPESGRLRWTIKTTVIISGSLDQTGKSSQLAKLYCDFALLQTLMESLFHVPARSSSVKSLASHWTHHDITSITYIQCCLESLVYFKCNYNISMMNWPEFYYVFQTEIRLTVTGVVGELTAAQNGRMHS